jgi:hypothetical protein
MTVYLIHLDQPLPRGMSSNGTPLSAGHYMGCADDLIIRIDEHVMTTWEPLEEPVVLDDGRKRRGEKHGPGATFMGFVNFMGVPWRLARTWEGGYELEKKLKNRKQAPRLCPICNPEAHRLAKEQAT